MSITARDFAKESARSDFAFYEQRPVPTTSRQCYCTRCRGQERAPCKHRFSNTRNAPPPDIAEAEELLIEIWSGWRFPGP